MEHEFKGGPSYIYQTRKVLNMFTFSQKFQKPSFVKPPLYMDLPILLLTSYSTAVITTTAIRGRRPTTNLSTSGD